MASALTYIPGTHALSAPLDVWVGLPGLAPTRQCADACLSLAQRLSVEASSVVFSSSNHFKMELLPSSNGKGLLRRQKS